MDSRQLKANSESQSLFGKETLITSRGSTEKDKDQTTLTHQCGQAPKKVKLLTRLGLLVQGQGFCWGRRRPWHIPSQVSFHPLSLKKWATLFYQEPPFSIKSHPLPLLETIPRTLPTVQNVSPQDLPPLPSCPQSLYLGVSGSITQLGTC